MKCNCFFFFFTTKCSKCWILHSSELQGFKISFKVWVNGFCHLILCSLFSRISNWIIYLLLISMFLGYFLVIPCFSFSYAWLPPFYLVTLPFQMWSYTIKDTSPHAWRNREAWRQAGSPGISEKGSLTLAHPRAVPGGTSAPWPRADAHRCESMGEALWIIRRSVCVCWGASLLRGMGHVMGLKGSAFQDCSSWWLGLSALGARYVCAEQLKESAARVTRGSRTPDRETVGLRSVGGAYVGGCWRRDHSGVSYWADWVSPSSYWRDAQRVLPTSGPSSRSAGEGNRVRVLAMFMFPVESLQSWEAGEVAVLLSVHVSVAFSQPCEYDAGSPGSFLAFLCRAPFPSAVACSLSCN